MLAEDVESAVDFVVVVFVVGWYLGSEDLDVGSFVEDFCPVVFEEVSCFEYSEGFDLVFSWVEYVEVCCSLAWFCEVCYVEGVLWSGFLLSAFAE